MLKPALRLTLFLALAAPVAVVAETYYVPIPLVGPAGRPQPQLEIAKTVGGPQTLIPTFAAAGQDGASLTGAPVDVNNDVKPNVFAVRNFVDGNGVLKLTGDPGIAVASGALFLDEITGLGTWTWPLPILTQANAFAAGTTAYIQNLARNSTGSSNLEIANLGAVQASCQYRLRRPAGSFIGPLRTVAVKAASDAVVANPLQVMAETGAVAGVRAEVRCDQPFYAYGTFVSPGNVKSFRMLYPFDGPPTPYTEAVNINLRGVFFRPVAGASEMTVTLPLVPDKAYRKATIDFDMNLNEFSPIFSGVVGMFHTGGPRFNKTLYFGSFIRGNRNRSLIDQGSPVVEPALKFASTWQQGANYHFTIVYDAENALIRYLVTQGSRTVFDVTGGAYNLDLADRGQPVKLNFGLAGIADQAYFPPVGWKFSNLKVKVER
jgi:hypothetical protein